MKNKMLGEENVKLKENNEKLSSQRQQINEAPSLFTTSLVEAEGLRARDIEHDVDSSSSTGVLAPDVYDEVSGDCDTLWCSSKQRNVTRTVLESIGSPPKERSETLHECLWSGVRCRGSQVTSLQLIGNKGSTGPISENVGLLTELEDLILCE